MNQINTCCKVALDLRTYYAGQNQATHPNVISFEEPWHGYRYYMAYTPYPYSNGHEENPCLAASNDLISWEKPEELINPIACAEENQCDELKDTDQLEMWYLGRLNSDMHQRGPLYCFRKVSDDGIHWQERQTMYCFSEFNLASPTIFWDETGYHFWGIRNSAECTGLYYMHSTDGVDWGALQPCSVPRSAQNHMWHGALTIHDGIYHFVWVGNQGDSKNNIYLSVSSDGLNFSQPRIIVTNDAGWDYLYRPALLIENGMYYCFYGVVRCDNRWLIGMSRGTSLDLLVGISTQDVAYHDDRISTTRRLKLKRRIHTITGLIVPRMVLLMPLVLVLQLLSGSVWLATAGSVALCMVVYTCFDRKRFCAGGILMGLLCAIFANYVHSLFVELLAQFLS